MIGYTMGISKIRLGGGVCIEHSCYESVCMHCVALAINELIDAVMELKAVQKQLLREETEA